jgi:hypothetical protein
VRAVGDTMGGVTSGTIERGVQQSAGAGAVRGILGWATGAAFMLPAVALFFGAHTGWSIVERTAALVAGAAGGALSGYWSAGAEADPADAWRRAAAWAAAFVAAVLVGGGWDALGASGRWTGISSPDSGPPAATLCPLLFGALGGLLSGLAERRAPLRRLAAGLVGLVAWTGSGFLGWKIAVPAAYLVGLPVEQALGTLFPPLAVVGAALGAFFGGFVAGLAAAGVAIPITHILMTGPARRSLPRS